MMMQFEKEKEFEGRIVEINVNMIDDIAKLIIEIDGRLFLLNFSFKSGNYKIITNLSVNMILKFKGMIDDEQIRISNLHDIWVKII